MATVPKIAMIPSGYKATKVYSVLPTDGSADLTFARAGVANRVASNGLIEEMATDVPRLDYLDGSCPSLLLEPQSTNEITYSEEFDNVSWSKSNASVSANSIISPKGDLSADSLVENTSTSSHVISSSAITITANTKVTFSTFIKVLSGSANRYIRLQLSDSTFTNGARALFDVQNGTESISSINFGAGSSVSSNIEAYGDGWYRVSLTTIIDASSTSIRAELYLQNQSTTYSASYTGDGVSGVNLFGGQVENFDYMTSYIPTSGATATRVAETLSKSGLSNYFGQTEGVIYLEMAALDDDGTNRILGFGTDAFDFDNSLLIRYSIVTNRITAQSRIGGVYEATLNYDVADSTEFAKIALKYKENDFALWVNGVERATDTSASVPTTLSAIWQVGGGNQLYGKIKDFRAYDTALTDAELTTLTTI